MQNLDESIEKINDRLETLEAHISKLEDVAKKQFKKITAAQSLQKRVLKQALELLENYSQELNLKTDVISKALGRGKHTTRHVELLEVCDGYVADTPGFGSLDLEMDEISLAQNFREFFKCKCKFNGCLHLNEPGCQVKEKDRIEDYNEQQRKKMNSSKQLRRTRKGDAHTQIIDESKGYMKYSTGTPSSF